MNTTAGTPTITPDDARRIASRCCGVEFLQLIADGHVTFHEADRGRNGGYYVDDALVNFGGTDNDLHRIVITQYRPSMVTGESHGVRDGARVELTQRGRERLARDLASIECKRLELAEKAERAALVATLDIAGRAALLARFDVAAEELRGLGAYVCTYGPDDSAEHLAAAAYLLNVKL